jgi:uncharacterized repeat protein (TIGR03837 family)
MQLTHGQNSMISSVSPPYELTNSDWVIFCRVIDNLGDAGVCWRLAQQLSQEFGKQVELVIDQPELLKKFGSNYKNESHIKITHWLDNTVPALAAVTVSAFACKPPEAYLQNLLIQLNQQGSKTKRYWFNLEYLSAQEWVGSHHLLDSTKTIEVSSLSNDQADLKSLTEVFFFPGFTAKTGGLIREQFVGLKTQTKQQKRSQRQHFAIDSDAFAVSLFCYPNAPITALCNALLVYSNQQPVHLLLTAGLSLPDEVIDRIKSYPSFKYQNLPFLSQRDYDSLLSACDLNFVRGEDSLVRAIWAKNPFIWQAYPQDQETQQDKLQALLAHYFDPTYQEQFAALFLAWNFPCDKETSNFELNLQNCLKNWAGWQDQTEIFCDRLCQQPDLAAQLVAASV